MAHILAIANQKGGVGKTTTAVNLAASLAIAERRTLLLDADPQGNATSGVGILKHELQLSLYDSLVEGRAPREIVLPVPSLPHLSVLPATQDLVGAELQLVERQHRESALRAVLDPLQADYDYIVVDCPPSLGLLTLNVLASANTVLIPIQCEYYGLEGISQLLNTVRLVQQNFNPGLAISGVLLTMYDARLNLCRQVAEDAKEYFGAKMFVTPIPRNVRLAEAPSFGKPILLYDVQSVGAKSYLSVAQELIRRLEGVPSNERPRAAPSQPADGVAALEAAAARVAAEHSAGEHSGSHERAGGSDASNHGAANDPGEDGVVDAGAAAPAAVSEGAAADSAAGESPVAEGAASHDRAPQHQASLERASNDRAPGERDSEETAATETGSNPGDTDQGSSEAAATDAGPVVVHTAEATASETEPVATRAGQIDDTNAAELAPQQSQSHEPEVTT
jgi:chromosome partitioning protein